MGEDEEGETAKVLCWGDFGSLTSSFLGNLRTTLGGDFVTVRLQQPIPTGFETCCGDLEMVRSAGFSLSAGGSLSTGFSFAIGGGLGSDDGSSIFTFFGIFTVSFLVGDTGTT